MPRDRVVGFQTHGPTNMSLQFITYTYIYAFGYETHKNIVFHIRSHYLF